VAVQSRPRVLTGVSHTRQESAARRYAEVTSVLLRVLLLNLVVAAANDALRKARDLMQQEMGRLVGGLGLPPGLFPPGG